VPSPRASDALLSASSQTLPIVFTNELLTETSWASFPLVHGGCRDTNSIVTVSQDSRPTRYNITMIRTRAEGYVGFSKLTQLTMNKLEQVHKRS
jgi:hypothetical protein